MGRVADPSRSVAHCRTGVTSWCPVRLWPTSQLTGLKGCDVASWEEVTIPPGVSIPSRPGSQNPAFEYPKARLSFSISQGCGKKTAKLVAGARVPYHENRPLRNG